MERYIIPFDFQGKSYYVFIDKDEMTSTYIVGKILPHTSEIYLREIPFTTVAETDSRILSPDSLDSAIRVTLYKFLHARGWLAFAN